MDQTSHVHRQVMKHQKFMTTTDQSAFALPLELPLRKQNFLEKVKASPLPVRQVPNAAGPPKMTCLCAPTTHAGSFRCRLHRAPSKTSTHYAESQEKFPSVPPSVSHLSAGGSKSIGKVFSRISLTEKRSKGESRLPNPSLRSKNLLKPSRLSKVTFACDIKEEDIVAPQPQSTSCIVQTKFSKQTSSLESTSFIRLMALRKCQSLMKEDGRIADEIFGTRLFTSHSVPIASAN